MQGTGGVAPFPFLELPIQNEPVEAVRGASTRWRSWLDARLVPLVVAATFFLQLLDTSILNTSLPRIAESFGVRALDLSAGVTVYLLCFAAFLPLSGWFSERFGARTVFLSAVAVFTAASAACGLSGGLTSFVAARAVQGMGASMMTPVGRVIVLRSTPKSSLLEAIATITMPSLTAPLVGPVVGGFLTTWFSWRWNFFLNIPVGMAAFVLIRRFVPELPGSDERRFDLRGFLLTSSALAALLHGLEALSHRGFGWVSTLEIAWGISGGALAIRHLRRAEHPLLDLSVLAFPSYRLTTVSAGLWIRMAISTTPFLLPLLFQVGMGESALVAGTFLSCYFAGNFVMKSATTRTLRRFGFRTVVLANGAAVALSLAAMVFVGSGSPAIALGAFLFAAGLVRSMEFSSLSSLAFADIPEHLSAPASTLSSMLNQSAVALGVSFSAGLLEGSRAFDGRSRLELVDFHRAFVGASLCALAATLRFLALPSDAGSEISGRAA